ncbi:hypothetical protein ONS95_009066 [Cadophora gregata]|uniref:uncharacterized protein n=1 Tax=Cadophora gregata TaxID=51156 RepID=UPI0026DD3782|nr:uncharacterized protein ONS95_009066 [Cadophora gregata]KAK0124080.1 hypothetical protein ONS95_009066 [Cadophora gregata]
MPKAPRKTQHLRRDSGISFMQQSNRSSRERYVREKRGEKKIHATKQSDIQHQSRKLASGSCVKIPNDLIFEDDGMSEDEPRGRSLLRNSVRGKSGSMTRNSLSTKRTALDDTAMSQETIHNAIIHAVNAGKISFQVLADTNLTIESITEFFKRHNDELMSQWKQGLEAQNSGDDDSATVQHPQDIASQPFSVLQVAFGWARSKLREQINEKTTKRKKDEAGAQLKRAREIYLKKKAAGITNPKDLMASVSDALKAETPTPKPHPTVAPITITMTGRSRQHAPTEEDRGEFEFQRDHLANMRSSSLHPPDNASSHRSGSDVWVAPFPYRKRGEPVDALANLSPPLELPFPEKNDRKDAAPASLPSTTSRLNGRKSDKGASIRDKRKYQSLSRSSGINLSEEMAMASITDIEPSYQRPRSPGKKQRGTRGVAPPIHRK